MSQNVSKVVFRRFEVQIILPPSEIPRKIRNIHASGLFLLDDKSIIIFTLNFCILEIGHLLQIKGMVVRATDVKPSIMMATYLCEVCGSKLI